MMSSVRLFLGLLVVASLGAIAGDARAAATDLAHVTAHRAEGPITIDGRLDDRTWTDCPPMHGFVQRFPDAGKPPAEDTSFRVAYDDDAIYVAVHMRDAHPDEIRGLLTRRDMNSASDWVLIGLDSYHDRRTAFVFGVNPAGVQRDLLIYDDAQQDDSWDAVWTSATHIDRDGWTAEFRIPLGQLRFAGGGDQTWGFQVERIVARTGEESVWSPWPRSSSQVVSRFGTVDGLDGLHPGRRLELLPYVTGGALLDEQIDAGDPFGRTAHGRGTVGLDVRLGLTSAITLAATINPDFGQVEADPSQVNLSANELFFPEKRPFFLEGTDIFNFSLGQGDGPNATESLFYSRRIGAPPHGDTSDYAFVDAPKTTTIYGAAKISGKTRSGWSVGLLDAITSREIAHVDDGAGMRSDPVVEPLGNYLVGRIKKDLRQGRTSLGAAVTAVDRDLAGTGLEATMRDQAYAGGLQVQHRFGHDQWETNLRLLGSWVHGSTDAIADLQQQQRHLFQRPDQTHVRFDPTRTSLAGGALLAEAGKFGGKHWRFGLGADTRTPGFEVNDLGFQRGGDYYVQWGFLQYRDDEPGDGLLAWNLNVNTFGISSYEPQLLGVGGNLNGSATFKNHWSAFGGAEVDDNRWDPGALRGGPELRESPTVNGWVGASTDGRKAVIANLSAMGWTKPVNDSHQLQLDAGLTVQARSNLDFYLGPSVMVRDDDSQYIDQLPDAGGTTRYLFGRIHQITTSLTVRANWTFSPHLSLQVYAEPFIATGRYSRYKEAADTHAIAYADRFLVYDPAAEIVGADSVMVDRDGDGAVDLTFGRPDFSVRELRSNVVLRWEYRPGSAVFLIWSHDRADSLVDGRYRLGADLAGLASAPAEHVVMLKANYWIGA